MSDHHAGYLVTLAADIHEDEAAAVMTALRMVRGVIAVEPVLANFDQTIAQNRADTEWRRRLIDMARRTADT